LIELTKELLAEMETMASLMFTKKEIAFFLELSASDFREILDDGADEPYKLFMRGRLKQEANVRKSIFDLASNGSSPAQAFAFRLIENAKLDDL
jgi:hypothetical protein